MTREELNSIQMSFRLHDISRALGDIELLMATEKVCMTPELGDSIRRVDKLIEAVRRQDRINRKVA